LLEEKNRTATFNNSAMKRQYPALITKEYTLY